MQIFKTLYRRSCKLSFFPPQERPGELARRLVVFSFAPLETEGKWKELTFAKTSGTVTRDREKNWPVADLRVPSNDPRSNYETHFSSSALIVSVKANNGVGKFYDKKGKFIVTVNVLNSYLLTLAG